jgi:hypothetical protein
VCCAGIREWSDDMVSLFVNEFEVGTSLASCCVLRHESFCSVIFISSLSTFEHLSLPSTKASNGKV